MSDLLGGVSKPMPAVISFSGVALLVCAFVLSQYCRQFRIKIKRRWEALSAGVAVAYVFLNVIPELEELRPTVAGSATGSLLDAEKRIYLWTLSGFVTFVGLSRLPVHSSPKATRTVSAKLPFWVQMAGYSLYTLLICIFLWWISNWSKDLHASTSLWAECC